MPYFNIIKKHVPEKSFRNESIKGQFDLAIKEIQEKFEGNIDIENKDWKIGVIVGNSGTGKSSIANELFKNYFVKHNFDDRSIIDNMPINKSTEQITSIFNSVGFGTVWSWLKPYNVLSTGEKMRVDLAYDLLSDNEIIIFDEFSSVVDRTIAKTSSFAINKAIKKRFMIQLKKNFFLFWKV
jgi:ABC-type transport system involved in cytochrome bd biosynthesis fused ATPase/permease subunit